MKFNVWIKCSFGWIVWSHEPSLDHAIKCERFLQRMYGYETRRTPRLVLED